MKKVVIYTGQRCAHCDWAIALLNKKNIEFTEYNIAIDVTKREEMLKKSNGSKTDRSVCKVAGRQGDVEFGDFRQRQGER